jgi:hypothetical protein
MFVAVLVGRARSVWAMFAVLCVLWRDVVVFLCDRRISPKVTNEGL